VIFKLSYSLLLEIVTCDAPIDPQNAGQFLVPLLQIEGLRPMKEPESNMPHVTGRLKVLRHQDHMIQKSYAIPDWIAKTPIT
jgi:hypothetical protein